MSVVSKLKDESEVLALRARTPRTTRLILLIGVEISLLPICVLFFCLVGFKRKGGISIPCSRRTGVPVVFYSVCV